MLVVARGPTSSAPHRSVAPLSQVLTPAVGRGWIRSEPGPTGGYVANVDGSKLSVLDLIEAVEGPTDEGRCVLEDRPCQGGGQCVLHRPWDRARGQLMAELRATPLATPLAGASPGGDR